MTKSTLFVIVSMYLISFSKSYLRLKSNRFIRQKSLSTFESNEELILQGQVQTWKSAPCFNRINPDRWDLLEQFCSLLTDWNSKVNLISRKDIDQLVPNHLVPCLAMALVRKFESGENVVDVGTGGGLPGIPMAILHPETHFTLIDSNSKKMMIVKDIATRLKLENVEVKSGRAEAVEARYDFILGRAVAAIPKFLGFSAQLLNESSTAKSVIAPPYEINGKQNVLGSGLLYLKGGDFLEELKEAKIKNYSMYPVSNLVTGLTSDKFVLYVPSSEIIAFRKRNR